MIPVSDLFFFFSLRVCLLIQLTRPNDEWHTQYAEYQDKWPSDSLPACKDLTSYREPVETVSNLSHPSLFSQIVTFAQISTRCHLTVFPAIPLSQQRSTLNQIFDALWRGHNPITHARRARCLAYVGSIFNGCCRCRKVAWDRSCCRAKMCMARSSCICFCTFFLFLYVYLFLFLFFFFFFFLFLFFFFLLVFYVFLYLYLYLFLYLFLFL